MMAIAERMGRKWRDLRSPSRLLHLVALLTCMAVAVYQVGQLLALYCAYPVTVTIEAERKSNITFPGITICT